MPGRELRSLLSTLGRRRVSKGTKRGSKNRDNISSEMRDPPAAAYYVDLALVLQRCQLNLWIPARFFVTPDLQALYTSNGCALRELRLIVAREPDFRGNRLLSILL